jgi:hypothetical protein
VSYSSSLHESLVLAGQDGMHQNRVGTLGNPRILSVYTGSIHVLFTDFLSVHSLGVSHLPGGKYTIQAWKISLIKSLPEKINPFEVDPGFGTGV